MLVPREACVKAGDAGLCGFVCFYMCIQEMLLSLGWVGWYMEAASVSVTVSNSQALTRLGTREGSDSWKLVLWIVPFVLSVVVS